MSERRRVLELFEAQKDFMEEKVNAGIEQNRKGYVNITIKDSDGEVIPDAKVKISQKSHEFKFGANIVTHSTTKYLDGHATSVGGVVVEGGNYNWANGKYPELSEPDPSYHGLVYTDTFPEAPYSVKMRVQLVRDLGCIQAPMNGWLTNLGMETLALRMERHSENALKLAEFLKNHPKVDWVSYPMLPGDSQYELAKKYLRGGSGVLSFGVKGGKEAAAKLLDTLKLAALVVHVADVRTSVLHPASMTHRQLTDEQLVAAGVKPELVRVSVGIEDIEDIKADFDEALNNL